MSVLIDSAPGERIFLILFLKDAQYSKWVRSPIFDFSKLPEVRKLSVFVVFLQYIERIEPLNPPFECFLNLENCRKYLFRVRLMNPQMFEYI